MTRQELDIASFIAGCATAALGVLLLLDRLDVLNLTLAYFAPAAVAVIGVILLARGWGRATHGERGGA